MKEELNRDVKKDSIKFTDAAAYSSMSEEEFEQKMKKAGY